MSRNLIHLVTATKYRRQQPPAITGYVELDARRVLIRIGIEPIALAFDRNHLHVLFDLPRTRTLEEIARRLKATTSKHVREDFAELAEERAFWQRRFLYTSLGSLSEQQTARYIKKQRAFQ